MIKDGLENPFAVAILEWITTRTKSAMRTIQQFLVVVVVYPMLSVPGFGQTSTTVGICDRTPQVRAGILAAISDPPPDCRAVLETDLAGITSLILGGAGITTLASGDFAGLSGLEVMNLLFTGLTTLPADVFDGLTALRRLSLADNTSLTTLPNGVFDSLTALEELGFDRNRLTTLPDGIFDRLTELERLSLGENSLTTLPDGVFDGLSALEQLGLADNELTTLPDGVFDGLSVLERLDLRNNNFTTLTGLPVGVFDDVLDTLGTIGALELFRVDIRVRRAHFVCSRPDAETIVADTLGVNDCLRITTAQLAAALPNANLSALAISAGMLTPEFDRATFTYSATVPNTVATLTITPTAAGSGATVAGTVNAGAAMTTTPFTAALDVGANEIEVVVTAADSSTLTYRLTVTRDVPPTVNICDRTAQVVTAILAAINPTPACDSVPETALAGITELNLTGSLATSIAELANGDFAGLSGLVTLNLTGNPLTTLPAGVFDDLSVLVTLDLSGNALTTLPADVFNDLSALETLSLSDNDLTTLPADVFNGLSALETLSLSDNDLTTTLPAGVFDDLSALESLSLNGNAFTTLPDGVFDDVLDTLGAIGEDSSASFRVDDTVRDAHFVCSRANADTIVAATAGVDDCLRITAAQLSAVSSNADLSALVISAGTLTPAFDSATFTYSATVPNTVAALTITPTTADSGATVAVTVNAAAAITTAPFTAALNVGANAIEVVVTAADSSTQTYGLTVTRDAPPTVNICDRTAQVVTAILAAINPTPACDSVPETALAGIRSLSLILAGISSLASGDFTGLSALVTLTLNANDLTTLPADVFNGLSALETLSLSDNDLTTLPTGVFDDLSALESLSLNGNAFTTLPDGVFDDVLDTLGAIGEDSSASFRVDDTVRDAHFVCSRANADTIVAATAGVDDCLRITAAQLSAVSSNADLSALVISAGTLTPAFDSATFTYSATVPNTVAALTITPTTADSGATVAVTVNAAAAITTAPFTAALNVGANAIEVVVTAADSSTQTYGLTVTRADPLDLNQDQTVNAQDAQILYYLSLTPRPDTLLNTLLGNAENIAALEAGAAALAGADRYDLVDDNVLDQNDWRLLYYALRFEDELSASPELRNALGVTQATLDAVQGLIE